MLQVVCLFCPLSDSANIATVGTFVNHVMVLLLPLLSLTDILNRWKVGMVLQHGLDWIDPLLILVWWTTIILSNYIWPVCSIILKVNE